ncbi:hypothetical protein IWZ03DRAFT_53050 [Phyllosticta citriasiana]|uniref:Uncharacterized protein n=1 Tax=Phyllosticta citriasiana TaxID=595635 RepID=A0ABR1KDF3_9PEZI
MRDRRRGRIERLWRLTHVGANKCRHLFLVAAIRCLVPTAFARRLPRPVRNRVPRLTMMPLFTPVAGVPSSPTWMAVGPRISISRQDAELKLEVPKRHAIRVRGVERREAVCTVRGDDD